MFPAKTRIDDKTVILSGEKADSIVVHKEKRIMLLYNDGSMLKRYSISLGKNPVGPKLMEGDKKTPEGKYIINGRNPNSSYHLSLRISYPDSNDEKRASQMNIPPGGDIMIHGFPNHTTILEDYYVNNDWTDGCIAVTNNEIEELWNTVDDGTPIVIYP